MKTIYKTFFLLISILTMAGVHTACTDEEDDLPGGGKPSISYIRLPDPESADSLLEAGYQGEIVVIVGENLQHAREVWFNNRQGRVVPTYITNNYLFTQIPSKIPTDITNKLKIIFANGDSIMHDFAVEISEPEIGSMDSEYVLAGDIAIIRGDYFYEPLTVTFTGGVEGEVVEVIDNMIQVEVPEGAEPGPITISTNFGKSKSSFWFRDNRNIFISSDPFTGWWNESFVVTDPGAEDPAAINGNYIRVKQPIGGWAWLEVAGGPPDAMGEISKNIPAEAIRNPENYNLKFEVNTVKPYNSNMIKINVGLSNDFNNDAYLWAPPLDTQGKWETVTIPLEEVMKDFETSVSPNGYYARILFHGPGALDADIAFDNFRVVPKK